MRPRTFSFDCTKFVTWLLVNALCLVFWASTYSIVAGEKRGLKMPPARYDRAPKVKPIVVYAKLRQTNRLCRNKETAARIGRRQAFYGCAMRIVGGKYKGRYLVYVATNAPIPAEVILRHEHGHVNGWRH